jgi:hypothetical protein
MNVINAMSPITTICLLNADGIWTKAAAALKNPLLSSTQARK